MRVVILTKVATTGWDLSALAAQTARSVLGSMERAARAAVTAASGSKSGFPRGSAGSRSAHAAKTQVAAWDNVLVMLHTAGSARPGSLVGAGINGVFQRFRGVQFVLDLHARERRRTGQPSGEGCRVLTVGLSTEEHGSAQDILSAVVFLPTHAAPLDTRTCTASPLTYSGVSTTSIFTACTEWRPKQGS